MTEAERELLERVTAVVMGLEGVTYQPGTLSKLMKALYRYQEEQKQHNRKEQTETK